MPNKLTNKELQGIRSSYMLENIRPEKRRRRSFALRNLGSAIHNLEKDTALTNNTKSVFCIDFSEIYPLLNYDKGAAVAFSFDHTMAMGKSGQNDVVLEQYDAAILNQLLFDDQNPIPVCISAPHIIELKRINAAIQAKIIREKDSDENNILSHFTHNADTSLDEKILERILNFHQEVKKNPKKTPQYYEEVLNDFLTDFFSNIPDGAITKIKDFVSQHEKIHRLASLFSDKSNLHLFNSIPSRVSIFDRVCERYRLDTEKVNFDAFYQFMHQAHIQDAHEKLSDTLMFVMTGIEAKASDQARVFPTQLVDAEALADLHFLNQFFRRQSVNVRIHFITRSPSLHSLAIALPKGYLDVDIRHPMFIPEIYAFNPNQLERLSHLIRDMSVSLKGLQDDITQIANSKEPTDRFNKMVQNLRELLLSTTILKDWQDNPEDYKTKKNNEDIERFVKYIRDNFAQDKDEPDLYMRAIEAHRDIDEMAADSRIMYHYANKKNFGPVWISKHPMTYGLAQSHIPQATEEKWHKSQLVFARQGYMTPVFHLYWHKFTRYLRPARDQQGASDGYLSYRVNNSQAISRFLDFFKNIEERMKKQGIEAGIRNYFKYAGDGDKEPSMDDVTKWLTIYQMKALFYAVFMQHRFAGIVCTEALSVLDPILDPYDAEFDAFNALGGIVPKEILLIFKELFLLRHYCSRAMAVEFSGERRGTQQSVESLERDFDRPYKHLARADRDLHFAATLHRVVGTGNMHTANYDTGTDARLVIARQAGYLEGTLKNMGNYLTVEEFTSQMRSISWSTASNARVLAKLAQSLEDQLKTCSMVGCTQNKRTTQELDYYRHLIARCYQVNLTALLLFLGDVRFTRLDTFLDIATPFRHKDVLGFVHFQYWYEKLKEYHQLAEQRSSPFPRSSHATIFVICEAIVQVKALRKEIRSAKTDKNEQKAAECNNDYQACLEKLHKELNSSSDNFRPGSFYREITKRLMMRVKTMLEKHLKLT